MTNNLLQSLLGGSGIFSIARHDVGIVETIGPALTASIERRWSRRGKFAAALLRLRLAVAH